MRYDVIIIGAGPGGIFSAYEMVRIREDLKIAVFESGHALDKRHCPIDGDKVKSCIGCKSCSIMSGFGGAGAFSDGKYNITNDFGGTLFEYIGKAKAIELMEYVDTWIESLREEGDIEKSARAYAAVEARKSKRPAMRRDTGDWVMEMMTEALSDGNQED